MEDIRIPYKKSPIIMSTVLSFGIVLLTAVALWFVSPRFDTGPGIVRTLAFYGLGGLVMLCAATLGLLGLLKGLDRRPAIILGRRGLQLHRSGTIDGVIPWPHIEAFEVTALKKQKLLIVKLIEPDWFIANAPAGKRWLLQLNANRYGSPVVVMTGSLEVPADEIAVSGQDYLGRHQRGE